MRVFALLIMTTLLSPFANAQWYETQGHAYVANDNQQIARSKAIENALKKALLVAGASVSSVQKVVNGLLTQDEINIRASGSINSLELVEETYTDDIVSVTIRADIFPQQKQCFSSDYRKSLLITKSHIKMREQANIGGIYQLDSSIMKRLSRNINRDGLYLNTKLLLNNNAEFPHYNNTLQAEKIKTITMSLADMTDSQFILFSEIEDISFANSENNSWSFWQENEYDRYFKLGVYIYNGTNGELVFDKSYSRSAPWTFTKRAQVDVNSNAFWSSTYGQIINQTLSDLIIDIDDNMMCQPTRGAIVKVSGNEININLGGRHGVKKGDEFSLLHLKNFTTDSGKLYSGYNLSPFKVKVIDVSRDSARAITVNNEVLDGIQQDDIAVRY